nr:TetR/AcrR family transcriptional regulator [Propionicimonas sp.]
MGTRDEHRDTTEAAILAAGLNLLAKGGAEALTVRGLARELSLVPSALYRYVRDRQDLLRLLIAHVHTDLADSAEAAIAAVPADDLRGRWRAFAYTLRSWALAHPHEWVLVYGTPRPEYQPPADLSYLPATRMHLMLIRLGVALEAAGIHPQVWTPGERPAIPHLAEYLELSGSSQISEQTALAGMAAWHLLGGSIYAEQFRQVGVDMVDYDPYYDAMVAASERLIFGDPA